MTLDLIREKTELWFAGKMSDRRFAEFVAGVINKGVKDGKATGQSVPAIQQRGSLPDAPKQ